MMDNMRASSLEVTVAVLMVALMELWMVLKKETIVVGKLA
jgi:hypothetical protein